MGADLRYEIEETFHKKLEEYRESKVEEVIEDSKNEVTEIAQEILDEALMPSLSKDFFQLDFTDKESIRVQIKPLKWKYNALITKALKPLIEDVLYHLQNGNQADCILELMEHSDEVAEIISILAANDDKEITKDDVENSTLGWSDIVQIMAAYGAKNKAIEVAVKDFFIPVLTNLLNQDEVNSSGMGKVILESLKGKRTESSTRTV